MEEIEKVTNDDIIIVQQLPVIAEKLYTVRAQIIDIVDNALSLEATEDTVKEIKKKRAELTKFTAAFEERRKDVKKKVLAPYEHFESVYKECITDPLKEADKVLKERIASVEDGLKDEIKEKVVAFFNEYAESLYLDFVRFEDMQLSINLSTTLKKYRETVTAYLDGVYEDVMSINSFDNKAEVMAEYKKVRNLGAAVANVNERHKAIEAEKAKEATPAEVPEIAPIGFSAPVVESVDDDPFIDNSLVATADIYEMTFTVSGTIEQLKAVKKFLTENNINFKGE